MRRWPSASRPPPGAGTADGHHVVRGIEGVVCQPAVCAKELDDARVDVLAERRQALLRRQDCEECRRALSAGAAQKSNASSAKARTAPVGARLTDCRMDIALVSTSTHKRAAISITGTHQVVDAHVEALKAHVNLVDAWVARELHVAIQAARCERAPMTTGSFAASRKLQSSLLSDGPLPMYRHCARGCVSASERAGSRADAPPGQRDGPSAEPTHPSPGRAAPAQGRRPPKPEAARGAPERCRRGPPRGRQQKHTGRKGTLQPLRTRGRRWRGEAVRVSLYGSQGSLRYKARAAPKARRKRRCIALTAEHERTG